MFKAIGDVTRLPVLELLPDEPRCEAMYSVGQLAEEVRGPQPNMSRHLQVLREAGLVQCRKARSSAYYWWLPDASERLRELLEPLAKTRPAPRRR